MALSREIPETRVYIDGRLWPEFVPLSVQRSAGGRRLDHATLLFDPGPRQRRIEDIVLARPGEAGTALGQEITITRLVAGKELCDFWGKISRTHFSIRDSGEELATIVARIEPFHFGGPLVDYPLVVPGGNFARLADDIVFNPLIDGQVFFNRFAGNRYPQRQRFYDPDSARTVEARQQYGGITPAEWKLTDAVVFLCEWLNEVDFVAEKYIKNPHYGSLLRVIDNERDVLRNVRLRRGQYLPQLLDELLEPLGYGWFVHHASQDERRISVFRRGIGARAGQGFDRTSVQLQPPGAAAVRGHNELKQASITLDAADSPNEVIAMGDFLEVEATFELFKGWRHSDDALRRTPDLMRVGHESFDLRPDAWRRWVLNEAGDYNRLRLEIRAPYDFRPLVAPYMNLLGPGDPIDAAPPRRRKFLPCLTLGDDGQPIGRVGGVRVEYAAGEQDGQTVWKEVTHECRLLQTECGVYFSGEQPPAEIYRRGDDARVRVTATVRFDRRVVGAARRQATSALADRHVVLLDAASGFHFRAVSSQSIFAADVRAGRRQALEVQDTALLRQYAEEVRFAWDYVTIDGQLQIEGVDSERVQRTFELGMSVDGIFGRNISLAGTPPGVAPRYPQIVGITRDYQRQTTSLILGQWRNDVRPWKPPQ